MNDGLNPLAFNLGDARLFGGYEAGFSDVAFACKRWLDSRGLQTPGEIQARQVNARRFKKKERTK